MERAEQVTFVETHRKQFILIIEKTRKPSRGHRTGIGDEPKK